MPPRERSDQILNECRQAWGDWIFPNQQSCENRESRSKATVNVGRETTARFLSFSLYCYLAQSTCLSVDSSFEPVIRKDCYVWWNTQQFSSWLWSSQSGKGKTIIGASGVKTVTHTNRDLREASSQSDAIPYCSFGQSNLSTGFGDTRKAVHGIYLGICNKRTRRVLVLHRYQSEMRVEFIAVLTARYISFYYRWKNIFLKYTFYEKKYFDCLSFFILMIIHQHCDDYLWLSASSIY